MKRDYGMRPMSAVGHKRTMGCARDMSALPPKADIDGHDWDVRFVPKADIPFSARCASLHGEPEVTIGFPHYFDVVFGVIRRPEVDLNFTQCPRIRIG
jgi:hypothetical protein